MSYKITYIDNDDQEQEDLVQAATEEEARRSIKPGCKEIISVIYDEE